MIKRIAIVVLPLLLSFFANVVLAGGSGLNVVVVVNQNSTNSVQLGNYYCEMRQVPPQNLLRINSTDGNVSWPLSDFTNLLLNPLQAMLANNKLTNQIDYVVLSMDIPYRIEGGANHENSTTSALYYGFIPDPNDTGGTCEIAANSSNPYAGSESIFRTVSPGNTSSNFLMASMITASNLSDAKMVVLQGATSDSTFPSQTVWLGKSDDIARNVRYTEFDNCVFNTRLRGNYSVMRTNIGNPSFDNLVLGYANGSYFFGPKIRPQFVPGAMGDNLTSFGGDLFEDTAGQTTILGFVTASAGISGSYGTVTEPCDYLQKFPDAQKYFYQSRGFSIGECYYQSVTNPYQGMVYGEPLAAPFAKPGAGAWSGIASNTVVKGTTNLSLQFTEGDSQHPIQQVDLFLDGLYFQTLTNVAPQSGNVLHVTLNGFATTYTVPASSTIKSVAAGLLSVLNGATYQANTKVSAIGHGDRIELQSTAGVSKTGGQISVSVSSTSSSGLTTFVQTDNATPSTFLDSVAQGTRSYTLSGTLAVGATITLTVTKTNNSVVTVSVTNASNSTLMGFAQQLVTAVTNDVSLQGPDGLYGDDVDADSLGRGLFNLYAQGGGYAAAQIKAAFTTTGVLITPAAANTLTENVGDLQPREHLYIMAGVSNLALTVPFATTGQADGYHELEAVAYEGSHVRTQTRATQDIVIQNTPLSATFTGTLTGTNTSLQPTLQFTVTANTNNINTIQLFSTGGVLAAVTNQSAATFAVVLTNLDVGLHPFYAIVTDNLGHQYRTQTQNVRFVGVGFNGANLIGVDYAFTLNSASQPVSLTWPATAGRAYTVSSTTNLTTAFQTRAVITPTSSVAQWTETNSSPAQQFYRVSVSP